MRLRAALQIVTLSAQVRRTLMSMHVPKELREKGESLLLPCHAIGCLSVVNQRHLSCTLAGVGCAGQFFIAALCSPFLLHLQCNHLANLFLERFNGHCVCYAGLQVRQTDRFVPVPVPFGLAIP